MHVLFTDANWNGKERECFVVDITTAFVITAVKGLPGSWRAERRGRAYISLFQDIKKLEQ